MQHLTKKHNSSPDLRHVPVIIRAAEDGRCCQTILHEVRAGLQEAGLAWRRRLEAFVPQLHQERSLAQMPDPSQSIAQTLKQPERPGSYRALPARIFGRCELLAQLVCRGRLTVALVYLSLKLSRERRWAEVCRHRRFNRIPELRTPWWRRHPSLVAQATLHHRVRVLLFELPAMTHHISRQQRDSDS